MVNRRFNELQQAEFQGDYQANLISNSGAAPTPDPSIAETHIFTMTAATVTVGAPLNTGLIQPGNKLYLIFVQDATGSRAIAWNVKWRNAPVPVAGTAGQRASFEFRWDGVSMQFVGGSTVFA